MKTGFLIVWLGLGLGIAPLAAASHAVAAPAIWLAAGDDWGSLNDQEQQLLRQHRGHWDQYSPEERSRLRQGADRYQQLSDEDRGRVQRERDRYESMSPDERKALREEYKRSKKNR